jgi:hypothetical protein
MNVDTIEVVNMVLRAMIGILSLIIAYEAYLLYVTVGGVKLSRTLKKFAVIFACYGVARVLAGIVDYALSHEHILVSVLVHDIAFLALWWVIRARRVELENIKESNAESVSVARENIEKAIVSVEGILQRN